MFTVVITEKAGGEKRLTFGEPEVTIGRVPGNDVVLPKGNVSKRHSRIVLKDNRFIVVDLKSTNGTYVNGRKITSPLVVKSGDKIYIGDFVLTLEGGDLSIPSRPAASRNGAPSHDAAELAASSAVPPLPSLAPEPMADEAIPAVLRGASPSLPPPALNTHLRASTPPAPPSQSLRAVTSASLPPVIGGLDTVSERPPVEDSDSASFDSHPSADGGGTSSLRPAAAEASGVSRYTPPPLRLAMAPGAPAIGTQTDLRLLMLRMAREFDVEDTSPLGVVDERRWHKADRVAQAKLSELASENPARFRDRTGLAKAAVHEAVGLGPLDGLLSDPSIFHVVVERFDRIRADRGHGLTPEPTSFSGPEALLTVVRRLAAQAEVRDPLPESLELSLPNGLQVVSMLRGAASEGPLLSVRRRPQQLKNFADLVRSGLLSEEHVAQLEDAIAHKRHVWVVGPRGRELGSLLSAALMTCPRDERVAVFERSPELALGERSALCLHLGSVDLQTLFNRLRHFSPERLVVHEVQEPELQILLSQLAHQHDGSLVSFEHASAQEALHTLERAAGTDTARRGVSLIVELSRGPAGIKVSGLFEPTLDATGKLTLLG